MFFQKQVIKCWLMHIRSKRGESSLNKRMLEIEIIKRGQEWALKPEAFFLAEMGRTCDFSKISNHLRFNPFFTTAFFRTAGTFAPMRMDILPMTSWNSIREMGKRTSDTRPWAMARVDHCSELICFGKRMKKDERGMLMFD